MNGALELRVLSDEVVQVLLLPFSFLHSLLSILKNPEEVNGSHWNWAEKKHTAENRHRRIRKREKGQHSLANVSD